MRSPDCNGPKPRARKDLALNMRSDRGAKSRPATAAATVTLLTFVPDRRRRTTHFRQVVMSFSWKWILSVTTFGETNRNQAAAWTGVISGSRRRNEPGAPLVAQYIVYRRNDRNRSASNRTSTRKAI